MAHIIVDLASGMAEFCCLGGLVSSDLSHGLAALWAGFILSQILSM